MPWLKLERTYLNFCVLRAWIVLQIPWLKLERTYLNFRVLRASTAVFFFFQIIILFMHLLTLKNVILDFICMGLVDLRGARGNWKAKNTKWKILGTRSYNLAIHRQTLLPTGLIGLILHIYCYLSYIDTFQYVTQCSTCTRQKTLYFIMPRIYTNVYIVIGSHVSCITVIFKEGLHQTRLA